jgi:hypothetical protein
LKSKVLHNPSKKTYISKADKNQEYEIYYFKWAPTKI